MKKEILMNEENVVFHIEKGQLVHTKNPFAFFVNAKLELGSGM